MSGRPEMRVIDVMCVDVECCADDGQLADAARVMDERDCGIVLIVERQTGKATGRDHGSRRMHELREIALQIWGASGPR